MGSNEEHEAAYHAMLVKNGSLPNYSVFRPGGGRAPRREIDRIMSIKREYPDPPLYCYDCERVVGNAGNKFSGLKVVIVKCPSCQKNQHAACVKTTVTRSSS